MIAPSADHRNAKGKSTAAATAQATSAIVTPHNDSEGAGSSRQDIPDKKEERSRLNSPPFPDTLCRDLHKEFLTNFESALDISGNFMTDPEPGALFEASRLHILHLPPQFYPPPFP